MIATRHPRKTRRLLDAYSLPGNVCKLKNTIHSALTSGWSKLIKTEDLPRELQPKLPAHVSDDSLNAKDIEFKVKLIERTLVETGGNVAKSSRILKLSKSYVHQLMR